MRKLINKLGPYLLLLCLILPLLLPLLRTGFFASDDGDWMVIRLSAFHQTLRSGQFPVRFLYNLNHGYGYPVTNFLYPLPFYLGEGLHLLGFGFVDSVKVLFGLGFLLGAFATYLWISRKWGRNAGIMAAVFYTYFPYRIFDVYQRGSLGETVAFIFIPLVFYFLDQKKLIPAALATAALITSHNTLAFLFVPTIVVYAYMQNRSLFQNLLFGLLFLSLSAFFWFPALFDLQFTRASQVQVAAFGNYFLGQNNFLATVGLVLPTLLAVIFANFFGKKAIPILPFCLCLFGLFLASPLSGFLWNWPLLANLVQFPWRFLSLPAVFGAVLLGSLIQKSKAPLLLFVLAAVIISGLFILRVSPTFKPESFYTTNDDTTTVKNEYMPKWVKGEILNRPTAKSEVLPDGKVKVNRVYFPGWEVFVDGKQQKLEYEDDGVIKFLPPPNWQSFEAKFTETPIRKIADTTSLVAILLLIVAGLFRYNMHIRR